MSDRRCSTPTAAAESVAPEFSELVAALDQREQRLQNVMVSQVGNAASDTDAASERIRRAMRTYLDRLQLVVDNASTRPCLTDPTNIIDRRRIELSQTLDRFAAACDRVQERYAADLDRLAPRLLSSTSSFAARRHALDLTSSGLRGAAAQLLTEPHSTLARDAAALDALSPLKVLARGYSIAYDGDNRVVTQASSFAPGDELRVRMADGDVFGTVTSVSTHA